MPRTQFVAAPPPGSELKRISGPATHWVGQLLRQRKDPSGAAREDEAAYGPLYVLNMFGDKWIIANGPEAAQRILMNKDRVFANGPAWAPLQGPFFDRGLVRLDFDEHRAHRSIMQQAFGRGALVSYLKDMHEIADRHLSKLPEGSVAAGNPVLVHRHLQRLTLDIVLEVFMGARLPRAEAERICGATMDILHAERRDGARRDSGQSVVAGHAGAQDHGGLPRRAHYRVPCEPGHGPAVHAVPGRERGR